MYQEIVIVRCCCSASVNLCACVVQDVIIIDLDDRRGILSMRTRIKRSAKGQKLAIKLHKGNSSGNRRNGGPAARCGARISRGAPASVQRNGQRDVEKFLLLVRDPRASPRGLPQRRPRTPSDEPENQQRAAGGIRPAAPHEPRSQKLG